MEGERGNQKNSLVNTGKVSSDNVEDEEENDTSDDDEMYLEPGEPFGAFLKPTEKPYDLRERVVMLNQLLQNSQPPTRRQAIRVRIREELNQYFFEESDSDSGPADEIRPTRMSTRHNRPPSPRYSSADMQRSSEGQRRPVTGSQRAPSSRRGLDEQTPTPATTSNKR